MNVTVPFIRAMMLYLDSYIPLARIWVCICPTWVKKLSGQVHQAMLTWRCALNAALRMRCREYSCKE
ncbi:hypothetical protein K1719_006584 [Acacia pycnantha]|nr:hypothetical protein K1719_006584 [Acacia pycnantha]